jgi:uncharacterized protein YoxC
MGKRILSTGTSAGARITILILVFLCICFNPNDAPAAADFTSNSLPGEIKGLTAEEVDSLKKAKALIRDVNSPSKLAISPFDETASNIKTSVEKLNPNYISEVIALVPYTREKRQLEDLATVLSDIERYVGIPYWSVSMQKTYDLFDKMIILTRKNLDGVVYIEADQHMKPFEDYRASYEFRLEGQSLYFQSKNLTHISYKGIRSVSPGGMLWFLYVFRSGDYLVYYGTGAVKAFDMFGLFRDRLEVSFIGRVSAFFNHMQAQLKR